MLRQMALGGLAYLAFATAACTSASQKDAAATAHAPLDSLPATPDALYGSLFEKVQMQQVFPDGKTFVDCVPKRPVQDIMYDYGMMEGSGLNLQQFVLDNFEVPGQPATATATDTLDIVQHIQALWPVLTRQPDVAIAGSSLLPLPHPYVVPGGRFREIYYWDSYFTMLGLAQSGQQALIEHMINNFAHLIRTYGHIPNGNRSYYLSRSQPPFFSLMVQLLTQWAPEKKVYDTYLDAVEKEYLYWMEGDKATAKGTAYKRFVKLPDGSYLNRYFDEKDTPRQESHREDVETAEKAARTQMAAMRFASAADATAFQQKAMAHTYAQLRAGAASGWDFSSRWFANQKDLATIQTTDIIPVDLNCLLYHSEQLLHRMYAAKGNQAKANDYQKWAAEREKAIVQYCYDAELGFFTDYNFQTHKRTGHITAAGLFPFYFFDSSRYASHAQKAAEVVKAQLLAPGGLLTTPVTSGQQWDAPNGWAPLQWMAVQGLHRCGQPALAKVIATRWIALNKEVYKRTGKLMEKYNVVNLQLEAGGGEYPGQDGFGWTNGVLLALMDKYK